MQPKAVKSRRRLVWLSAGLLLGVVGVYFLRGPLTHAAVTSGLQRVGAGDIKLEVTQSTPWLVELENLAFKIKTQSFAASRVTLERAHWWQPTLGVVRIEGAQVPVTIDGSDTNPFAWASYSGHAPVAGGAGGGMAVPVDELSIDGQLIVRTSTHEEPLTLKFTAKPEDKKTWSGTVEVTGPGLQFKAVCNYGLNNQRLEFHSTALSLDLKPWQDVVQQLVVMPMGPWTMNGVFTGSVNGTYANDKLELGGRVNLNQGRLQNADKSLVAEGIAADFEFTDFNRMQSNPGTLRISELRTGTIVANDLDAELAFVGKEHFAIHRLTLRVLGGSMSAEPFKLALERRELEAVVLVDNLDVEKILAMSRDVPAKASGRVDGRLPIRIDEHGLRLGTGWLELKKGVYAELQLKAEGLITSGMSPNSPSYVVMKRVENGLLRLKLGALRLDVRPTDAQRGRSARLHLEGDPVDPSVKAPVILDLNVNGPLEQLLNFGMQQNVSIGLGN